MCSTQFRPKTLSLCLAILFCGVSMPYEADASKSPVKPRSMKYEIRKGSLKVGKARIDFNRARRRNNEILQKVKIQASIDPVGIAALRVDVNSYSWIGFDLFPRKAKWEWSALGKERSVKARYRGKRVDGTYRTPTKEVRTQTSKDSAVGDVVSLVAWLAGQAPKPGDILATKTYTGLKIYDVTLEVGKPVTLDLPIGKRSVLPIQATAKRPGKTRKFTVWIDETDFALMRLTFNADYIGAVDMVLVSQRT